MKNINIISVLFECGPTLINTLLNGKMWNEMWIYMSMSTLGNNGLSSIEDTTRGFKIEDKIIVGKLIECKHIDNDIKLVLNKI
jgi:riboflavin biosynthesis pyrimidine reductase